MQKDSSVVIRFKTHYCSISYMNDRIYCMKYTDHVCDFDVFDDLDSASEYVFTPPNILPFRLVLGEESE